MSRRTRNKRQYKSNQTTLTQRDSENVPHVPLSDEVLEGVPDETKIAYIQAASFRGPLPPPALFSHYDKTLPGSADRILKMAETEQSHRHGWEVSLLDAQRSDVRRGQWMGFGLGIAGLVVAVIRALIGHSYVAMFSVVTVIAGITAAIVKGHFSQE